ncbi:MAG: hypothetical protein AAGD07_00605 [Planctomycetota bacterium]
MERADRQRGKALVLSSDVLPSGANKVELQIIGGGVETVWPKDEQAGSLQPGATCDVDITYSPCGQGTSTRTGKDGKEYTDTYTTYRQRVYLSREQSGESSRRTRATG